MMSILVDALDALNAGQDTAGGFYATVIHNELIWRLCNGLGGRS